MRSRSQPEILTFVAQDAASNVFCYANADLRKGEEADEIFRFIAFWKKHHGALPGELVFDSKLTTYAALARLHKMEIPFITLRRRTKKLTAQLRVLPPSAWRTVTLEHVARKFRTPRVHEQKVTLGGVELRQLAVEDLGHDEPTILLTNQETTTPKKLITRYAQRMLIENALSDAVRFFHMNALSSSVALKVDFDLALMVIASGLYRMLAARMRGYDDAQARQIFRDLVNMPALVKVTPEQVTVSFHRRAHLPIVMASGLLDKKVTVPWWSGARLVLRADPRQVIPRPWKSRLGSSDCRRWRLGLPTLAPRGLFFRSRPPSAHRVSGTSLGGYTTGATVRGRQISMEGASARETTTRKITGGEPSQRRGVTCARWLW